MIEGKLPSKIKESTSYYQQRIDYCVKVFRHILSWSGIILIIVQIVKAFSLTADGENISQSIIITSILGILFLAASFPPFLKKVTLKFFSQIRYKSFGIYIYVFPILLTILILCAKVKLGPTSDNWQQISDEGGLSEYGTAIAYLLIAVFAYPIAKLFWQQGKKLMASLYYLLTFVSVFISMEEISWGQRLIGFEEPEFWEKHNAQSEFTLHNLSFFQEHLLDQSFLLVGLLGSLSWIILRYWQKRQRQSPTIDLSYIIPNWSISSFFYPTLIFHVLYASTDGFNFLITKDQEHCEFIMSLGILLFILINFIRQGQESDTSKLSFTDNKILN